MAYEPEIERLERRYQDDPARNFAQLAEAYRKASRLDDALTLLRGHLAERPNYVSGLVVLGRCLLDQQNDAEARDTFAQVLAVDAEHIIALRALGEIAARAGDVTGAKEWYTRLLEVDPMNEDAEAAMERLAQPGAFAPPPAEPAQPAAPPFSPPAPAATPEPVLDEAAAADLEAAAFGVEPAPLVDLPEYAGEEAEAAEAAGVGEGGDAGALGVSEFEHEEGSDSFMPRASNAYAQPREIEQIGHIEFKSRLPEEQSLLSVPEDLDEPPASPSGEREVDLGFGQGAEPAEAPETAEGVEAKRDLPLVPFDDALGWGAGERTSQQISQADLEEVAHVHEHVEAPVQELPGLETTEVPVGNGVTPVAPVEGLEAEDGSGVMPLEGLEPTSAESPASEGGTGAPPPAEGEEAAAVALRPEPEPPLLGLPVRDEGEEEPAEATPLVLDAQPEPVLTETMAELYVKQGMVDEAREVYQRLLAQRPGDARLADRLAALRARQPARVTGESGRYAASATGGQSARALLQAVLAARPVTPAPAPVFHPAVSQALVEPEAPEPEVSESEARELEVFEPEVPGAIADDAVTEPVAESEAPGEIGDEAVTGPVAEPEAPEPMAEAEPVEPVVETAAEPQAAEPEAPEPMDEAFSEDQADGALGAPTQPAADEVSLSAIFGDTGTPAPPPAAPPESGPRPAAAPRAPGGFSFDEFFGKSEVASGSAKGEPRRDTLGDDEGDDAFRDWLKGLKD